MSTTYKWRPKTQAGIPIDYRLKDALSKRFNGVFPITLTPASWDFLEGLRLAGIPGVLEIQCAIQDHGAVIVEAFN